MKTSLKFFLSLFFIIFASFSAYASDTKDTALSPEAAKAFVRDAVIYALENNDPKMDSG